MKKPKKRSAALEAKRKGKRKVLEIPEHGGRNTVGFKNQVKEPKSSRKKI